MSLDHKNEPLLKAGALLASLIFGNDAVSADQISSTTAKNGVLVLIVSLLLRLLVDGPQTVKAKLEEAAKAAQPVVEAANEVVSAAAGPQ